MVNKVPKLTIVDSTDTTLQMAYLKQKITELGLSQKELAKKLKKNPVTITRWVNGTRDISAANAIEIANILKCDPAHILFPPKKKQSVLLKYYTDNSNMLHCLLKKDKSFSKEIKVPGEFYSEETIAVLMHAPSKQFHNYIYLFERASNHNFLGFSEDAIGQVCFVTSKKKNRKNYFDECVAVVQPNSQNPDNLDLLHPRLLKPISDNTINIPIDHFEIAAPRKAMYKEKYLINTTSVPFELPSEYFHK